MTGGRQGGTWRSLAAIILGGLGVLCLLLSPPVVWGRNLLLNTDRYVQTLAPLASNPGVQDVVIRAVDAQLASHLEVRPLLDQVLPKPASAILAPMLKKSLAGLADDATTRFVRGPAFAELWTTMNRLAHEQVAAALTGKSTTTSGVQISSTGVVTLDLAPIIVQVKAALVDSGVSGAAFVPVVGATIEIAQLNGISSAQRAVRWLNTIANWLPWIGLMLIAGAVLAARRRRRAIVASALSVGAAMLLLGVAILVARSLYLRAIPEASLPHQTAAYLFDTLVRYLRLSIRLTLLASVLVAVGAWWTAPSSTVRTAVTSAVRSGAGWLDRRNVAGFIAAHAAGARIGVLSVPALVLLAVDDTSTTLTIVLLALAAGGLVLVEIARRRGRQPQPS